MSRTWVAAGLCSIVMAFILLWGTAIMSTGILLGLLTLAGLVVIYSRMPALKKVAIKFPAFCDVGAALATYFVLGGTLAGLVAAGVVGLGTSFLLNIQIEQQRLEELERKQAFIGALS